MALLLLRHARRRTDVRRLAGELRQAPEAVTADTIGGMARERRTSSGHDAGRGLRRRPLVPGELRAWLPAEDGAGGQMSATPANPAGTTSRPCPRTASGASTRTSRSAGAESEPPRQGMAGQSQGVARLRMERDPANISVRGCWWLAGARGVIQRTAKAWSRPGWGSARSGTPLANEHPAPGPAALPRLRGRRATTHRPR